MALDELSNGYISDSSDTLTAMDIFFIVLAVFVGMVLIAVISICVMRRVQKKNLVVRSEIMDGNRRGSNRSSGSMGRAEPETKGNIYSLNREETSSSLLDRD